MIPVSDQSQEDMFEQIISFENLYWAYRRAAKGKYDRLAVLKCDMDTERILWRLRYQLQQGTYRHGGYRAFEVNDSKPRWIQAAPFVDRILHHAICAVIEPLFQVSFVRDSYACQRGKGTHAAVQRLQHFMRSARGRYSQVYVLRCDIRQYFQRVDHEVLRRLLATRIGCPRTLRLLEHIIKSPLAENPRGGGGLEAMKPRGIPIGSLTSQLFANIYLNKLDQFVKHGLRERYYVRYMDDFIILGRSKRHLHELKYKIGEFLEHELRLELHPTKTLVHPLGRSLRFLGYEAFDDYRLLAKPTVQRFTKRLRRTIKRGDLAAAELSWQAFGAYASFARSRGLITSLEASLLKGEPEELEDIPLSPLSPDA